MELTPDGVPTGLVRTFRRRAHRQAFLNGAVLLRRLDVFRSIEDQSRRDDTEGESHLVVPATSGIDVHLRGSFHNPVYLLCCSEPGAEGANPNFGTYRVRIGDPGRLLSAMAVAAGRHLSGREVINAMLLRVVYTKGTRSETHPTAEERYRLMLAQKPLRFGGEREWRYPIVVSGAVPDSLARLILRIERMDSLASVYEG